LWIHNLKNEKKKNYQIEILRSKIIANHSKVYYLGRPNWSFQMNSSVSVVSANFYCVWPTGRSVILIHKQLTTYVTPINTYFLWHKLRRKFSFIAQWRDPRSNKTEWSLKDLYEWKGRHKPKVRCLVEVFCMFVYIEIS
jgi:hypothetical protein